MRTLRSWFQRPAPQPVFCDARATVCDTRQLARALREVGRRQALSSGLHL